VILVVLSATLQCWSAAVLPPGQAGGKSAARMGAAAPGFLSVDTPSLHPATAQLEAESGASETVTSLMVWLSETSRSALEEDQAYQRQNAEFALRTREEMSFAHEVSQDLFLKWVLPYRHFDEPVDNWRPAFFEKLAPLAKDCSTVKEAAERVIPAVFDGTLGNQVTFKPNNTPTIMAPVSETLRTGYASCTGLSILVADALRSVGVPARVVGTPEWNRPEAGNHNWIEVWHSNGWHFMDAAPVKAVTSWDKAWFSPVPAAQAEAGGIHGIYVPVWDASEANAEYTITWREPAVLVPAEDRTAAYLGHA